MLERIVEGLRATSPAELASVLAGLAYGVLAVRQDRRCWLFGGFSSAILAWLAAQARLPMQSMLQVAYVLMAGYGFWHWSRASRQRSTLSIGVWPWPAHVAIGVAIAAGTAALAPWVEGWTAAAWPRLDTATMLASLLATWMVARVRLENWLYWIAIDAVSLYLYAVQGLSFVALLYLVYLVIAVFGWFEWRGRLRRQSAVAGAP
ncbi:MAG: nicotinamide riboside transporter PnuC [Steroidobacteraceae bacterium]|jgi:nicotinamide mononucleotide transporter|nr:nicotinamide riboside transporter PnuC [Steroidobacteraceae bacterium]